MNDEISSCGDEKLKIDFRRLEDMMTRKYIIFIP